MVFGDDVVGTPSCDVEERPLISDAADVVTEMPYRDRGIEVVELGDRVADVVIEGERSASSRMAKQVNCLETEATWNTVEGVIGMPYSRCADP